MTFAERLNEARERRGWDRKTLASRAGLSEALVGDYCLGKVYPGQGNLIKLADALGITLDYLVDRKGKKVRRQGRMVKGLREARKARGLTQKQLSELSGIDSNLICRYETGKHEPTLFTLICLADALDISLDQLVGRTYKKEENHELLNH